MVLEEAPLSDIAPKRKCKAKYCTCDEIPLWNDVTCKDDDFLFGNPQLHFTSFNYLPRRRFLGFGIYSITLNIPV